MILTVGSMVKLDVVMYQSEEELEQAVKSHPTPGWKEGHAVWCRATVQGMVRAKIFYRILDLEAE